MDVFPIILVIAFFQIIIIQKPFPNLDQVLLGVLLVVFGLFVFILGLDSALFPIGEKMANEFAIKGNALWIIFFGFALGFSTTIAEPALTVVAGKAGGLAAGAGAIKDNEESIGSFVLGLRFTVAFSVGMAIAMGVLRIIKGWPLIWFIIGGYALIVITTFFAPPQIIGIAYDSGGITTSTITVPLVAALGVGLATAIRGRNPILDGFGLIALASLNPIIFVLAYGIFVYGLNF
ncbi:MAG: DUF1538 domain-containing protein [Nitrospinae bacterium]|nr:DUF1538 domain-containing protein [Nitrospinota bacterium]MZH05201.1 DUF1538 domain-containing protein [Nitrospinota bacterium]MZH15613.1 DUF1538 domain-containing protein [Nitrospinota bacterium]